MPLETLMYIGSKYSGKDENIIPIKVISTNGRKKTITIDGHHYVLLNDRVILGSEKTKYGLVSPEKHFLKGKYYRFLGIKTRKRKR